MTQPEGPRTRSAAAAAATPDAEDSQDGTERLRVEVASLTDAHGDLLIAVRALQASVVEMQTSLAATAAENRALRAAQMADTALLRPGEASAPTTGEAPAPATGEAPAPAKGVATAPTTGVASAPATGEAPTSASEIQAVTSKITSSDFFFTGSGFAARANLQVDAGHPPTDR